MSGTVGAITRRKIYGIMGTENDHVVRRELAELRRGLGRVPGEIPELWESVFDGFPEEYMSKADAPSKEEWAHYGALTLFAWHQQGRNPKEAPMHKAGVPFGAAVRMLARPDDPDSLERVRRKFNICASADRVEDVIYRMVGLINQMRSAGIALDYGKLADDLFYFQLPSRAAGVRLRWGQDFYRIPAKAAEKEGEKDGKEAAPEN